MRTSNAAISIRVNDVLGVAGFVLPGDRVDVLLTRTKDSDGNPYVDVLLQNIKVLAIDQSADDRKEGATVVKAVTVAVATQDAQKLTLAAGVGQLSLALREAASNSGEVTQRVTIKDLVAGEPAKVAENAGEEAETTMAPALAAVNTPKKRINAQIGVTRGVDRTVYDVPFAGR